MHAAALQSSTPTPAPPSVTGPYEVLDRISCGGMAEVFRARRTSDGRTVALKRLLPVLATEPEYVRMFADEARIAAQLAHPSIARVLDVGQSGGTWYMAQELVDGPDLRDLGLRAAERRQRMSVPAALHVAMEIAAALEYAHNRIDAQGRPLGLIHRDVSPQNILVGMNGEVKLVDFGIAKAEHRETRTRTGMIKGKFSYMSPEQARGLPLDARTDIFSLVAVLFELLTCERLFDGGSDIEILDRVRRAMVKVPSTLNSAVPTKLDRVLLKALSRSRRTRYQTAAELRGALAPFLGVGGAAAARRELVGFVGSIYETRRATTPPPPPPAAFRVPTPPPLPAVAAAEDPFEEAATRKWSGTTVDLQELMAPSETPTPKLVPPAQVRTVSGPLGPLGEERPASSRPRALLPAFLGALCVILAAVVMVLIITPSPQAPPTVTVAKATPVAPAAVAPVAVAVAVAAVPEPDPVVVAAAAPTQAPEPVEEVSAPAPAPAPVVKRTRRVRTVRKAAPAPPPPIQAPADASPAPAPAVAKAARRARPTPAAPKFGHLNLNSRPWATVYIDGREVGETPLYRHRVKAGRHDITLVNNKFGLRRELSVTVSSGEMKPLVVDLD